MSRYPSDDSLTAIEDFNKSGLSKALAPIQRDKLSHFFILLDHDKDGFITRKDFAILSEVVFSFIEKIYFVLFFFFISKCFIEFSRICKEITKIRRLVLERSGIFTFVGNRKRVCFIDIS